MSHQRDVASTAEAAAVAAGDLEAHPCRIVEAGDGPAGVILYQGSVARHQQQQQQQQQQWLQQRQ